MTSHLPAQPPPASPPPPPPPPPPPSQQQPADDAAFPARPHFQQLLPGPLIGFSGKDVLKEAWEASISGAPDHIDAQKRAVDFIREFRAVHSFRHAAVDEVVDLFEAAGIPRHQLAAEVLQRLLFIIRDIIRTGSQSQLNQFLNQSFSYLTVPELAHIPITTLDHLKVVSSDVWTQIVEHGLTKSPYIDLPLSIRHRIWMQEEKAFHHEVDLILDTVTDVPQPTLHALLTYPTMENRKSSSVALTHLLRLVQELGDELLATAIERVRLRAPEEENSAKRLAFANLYHDFVLLARTRASNNWLADVRRCAKILSHETTEPTLPPNATNFLLKILNQNSTSEHISLLLASTYSRDVIADQLIIQLYTSRSRVADMSNSAMVEQLISHLKSNAHLVNLTRLVLINTRGYPLALGKRVLDEEVMEPFEKLYPIMVNEMFIDGNAMLINHQDNSPPIAKTAQLTKMIIGDPFVRRVISTYCLQLDYQQDIVGLSRFRLLLDAVASTCSPRDEPREACLAFSLVAKVYE